jgi:hypothetical protein
VKENDVSQVVEQEALEPSSSHGNTDPTTIHRPIPYMRNLGSSDEASVSQVGMKSAVSKPVGKFASPFCLSWSNAK